MEADLLAGGREPGRAGTTAARVRRLLGRDGQVVLAALVAVLAVAVVSLRPVGPDPAAPARPAAAASVRPLPRVVLTQARVEQVRPQADGVLAVRLRLEGLRGLRLLSLRVDVPGSVVVLDVLPDALTAAGAADVRLTLLPRCPGAGAGLARAAVVAVVRRPGGPARTARVRLDAAAALPAAVQQRCGTAGSGLGGVVVGPGGRGPAGAVRTRALLSARVTPATVVGVVPGPGLAVEARTPLPLVLAAGADAAALVVDLRAKGCGGAPDTPPYLLQLEDGSTVAPSVDPGLRPDLDALRPFRCTTT